MYVWNFCKKQDTLKTWKFSSGTWAAGRNTHVDLKHTEQTSMKSIENLIGSLIICYASSIPWILIASSCILCILHIIKWYAIAQVWHHLHWIIGIMSQPYTISYSIWHLCIHSKLI
jgi:hypothetical protein